MKKKLFDILKFFFFLGIGSAILYFVYQKQDAAYQEECALKGVAVEDCSLIGKVITDITSADYFWLSLVFAVFVISNISRAIRWTMLLRPMGYAPKLANAFWCTMIGYLTNLGVPRAGEFIKSAMLSKYENIPVEKVMGTVVTDRIVDVISLAFVMGLALLVEYDTIYNMVTGLMGGEEAVADNGGTSILVWLGGLGILGIILLVIFFQRLSETRIFKKIVDVAKGFFEGIQTVRNLEKPGWFAFHSANIWFMYFAMTYLCFFAFAPTANLPAIAGLIVFVFGGWGIVVPSPGGMGTYHFMVVTSLALYGVSGDDAFSFANISFFSINLGCNVLLGVIGLILLPIYNKNYKPARVDNQVNNT